jgi:hypothetical protein
MRRSKQRFARDGFSISSMPAAACSCDKHDALIALGNALLILLQNDQDDDAYAHEDSKCGLTPIPPLGLPHGNHSAPMTMNPTRYRVNAMPRPHRARFLL